MFLFKNFFIFIMSKITLKFRVNANEAKMSGFLNALLGQHQININNFIQEFNYKTSNLITGLPIRLTLIKSIDKNLVKIFILGPEFKILLNFFLKKNNISFNHLYDCFLIFKEFYPKVFYFSLIFQLFGYLNTKKINIIF